MTQCIVMKWVGNLNNVPDGILQAREEIELKVREAAELNEKAAAIRNAAYMDSLKLESHIRTWWTDEEITKAKKLAEIQ